MAKVRSISRRELLVAATLKEDGGPGKLESTNLTTMVIHITYIFANPDRVTNCRHQRGPYGKKIDPSSALHVRTDILPVWPRVSRMKNYFIRDF